MIRPYPWLLGVLAITAALWTLGTTQHERRFIGHDADRSRIAALEHASAIAPSTPAALLALADGYLDARQPGMAVAAIERAARALRATPEVEHAYARALFADGRGTDALRAERRVVVACRERGNGEACTESLQAQSVRRIAMLEKLEAFGIEDAPQHPRATHLAYVAATRPVALAMAGAQP
jgi:hypothetical protein